MFHKVQLVIFHMDDEGVRRTIHSHIGELSGLVVGDIKELRPTSVDGDPRYTVECVFTDDSSYAELSLNLWMNQKRSMGPIVGDLIWWTWVQKEVEQVLAPPIDDEFDGMLLYATHFGRAFKRVMGCE